jgi:hypothetical protein
METVDLENYVKDDVERTSAKVSEVARKMRQAYVELVSRSSHSDDSLIRPRERHPL